MTNYPGPTKGSRAPGRRLARTAASAGLAIALGLGLTAPIAAPFISAKVAWAEPADSEAAAVQARGRWTFDGEEPSANTGAERGLSLALAESPVAQAADVRALGKSLHFADKSADFDARIANAITPRQDFSISLWIKADAGVRNGAKTAILQLGGEGRTLLYQRDNGSYTSFIGGNDIDFTKNPGRGAWHHVIFVKQSVEKTVTLYIDGENAGSGRWTETLTDGQVPLILGEHKNPDNMDRFQGWMDELCIYGKALTPEEVMAAYDSHENVKEQIGAQGAKHQLDELISKAEGLMEGADENEAYQELRSAIDAAKGVGADATIGEVKAAVARLEKAIGAVYALGLKVEVDPAAADVKTIDDGIFGINHRYAFNGYGSYDSVNKKVHDEFAALYDESNFGSIRYPGGTISNLFNWKETLGPQEKRTKQIHGFYNNRNQGGIAPNFGISEIGTFAADHGSEIIYVYALGRGDADDAADLIEFLNAEVGDNPNGGTDWAEVRAKNGHEEPYNVRYFEIGNEMNQGGADGTASQQYWTTTVLANPADANSIAQKSAIDGYIDGGTVSRVQEYAVVEGDWNKVRSISTGEPNQTFGMRYALTEREGRDVVIPNSVDVKTYTVNGDQDNAPENWTRVDSFENSSATDKHYVLDTKTGTFTFGDGKKGAIPEKGKRVKVSYKVERDGFIEVSDSMRETMDAINAKRADRGIKAGEMHVYSSYETHDFFNKMHERGRDDAYDGMAIHPYTFGDWPADMGNEAFYLQALKLGNAKIDSVRHMTEEMRRISGDQSKVPVISEYGIFRSTNTQVRSQAHALYIARQVMEFIKLGSPYIQKHCLVDWYSNGADSLGPTQQAVIQAVPKSQDQIATGEGEFTFFMTPSAYVFKLYNGTDAERGFGNHILPLTVGQMESLSNGVKQYDVLASKDNAGNVYLAVTNLHMAEKGAVALSLKDIDLTGRKVRVHSLSGDTFYSENTPNDKTKVRDEVREFVSAGAVPRIDLEPHSFTIVKVFAEEKPVEHTVTFKVDDMVWDTKKVVEGGAVTAPAEPVKEGYTFKYWALDGAAYDFSNPVTGDITLVAVFEKKQAPVDPAPEPEPEPEPERPKPERPKPAKPNPKPAKPANKGGLPGTGDPAGMLMLTATIGVAATAVGMSVKKRR